MGLKLKKLFGFLEGNSLLYGKSFVFQFKILKLLPLFSREMFI